MAEIFTEVFNWLPLCHLIDERKAVSYSCNASLSKWLPPSTPSIQHRHVWLSRKSERRFTCVPSPSASCLDKRLRGEKPMPSPPHDMSNDNYDFFFKKTPAGVKFLGVKRRFKNYAKREKAKDSDIFVWIKCCAQANSKDIKLTRLANLVRALQL